MNKLYSILVFLLFTLGASAQTSQAWKVDFFQKQETDLDAKVNHPVKDPNGRLCAIIKVETPYTGFTFDTGTIQVVKSVQQIGEVWVYVPKGVRKITIGHQRGILREYPLPTSIEEATVYVLRLVEGDGTANFGGAAVEEQGYLVIESEPSGAEVYIDDQYVGETPFQGLYTVGTRLNFRVKKQLYHDDIGIATVTGTQNIYTSHLQPAYGELYITSDPSGATVSVNGVTKGVTPLHIDEVPSGEATVIVKKDLYAPRTLSLSVQDGKTTTQNVALEQRFGTITIETLEGAMIYVNGELKGKTRVTLNLIEGLYDVEARKDNYRTFKQPVTINKKTERTLWIEPTPIMATLAVQTTPVGAEIYVDGVSKGKSPNVIKDIIIGSHTVKIVADGYRTYTKTLTLKEGEMETLKADLVKSTTSTSTSTSTAAGTSAAGTSSSTSLSTYKKPVTSVTTTKPGSTATTGTSTSNRNKTQIPHGFIMGTGLDILICPSEKDFGSPVRWAFQFGYRLGDVNNFINWMVDLGWAPGLTGGSRKSSSSSLVDSNTLGLSSLDLDTRLRFNINFSRNNRATFLEAGLRGDYNYLGSKQRDEFSEYISPLSLGMVFAVGYSLGPLDFSIYAGYYFKQPAVGINSMVGLQMSFTL